MFKSIFRKKTLLNRPLSILLVTNALILLSLAMLGPIYALFVKEVGGDLLDAGIAGAVFALAAGITVLISGSFTDKLKESKVVVAIGYLAISLGFFLYTTVDSLWSLLLIQALVGFGEAFYSPAFDCLYSRHLDKHLFGRQWGVWEATYYFVTAAGAAVGAFIVTRFGFNILFVIMGIVSLSSAVYILILPRKTL